jgi:hypothetical protein
MVTASIGDVAARLSGKYRGCVAVPGQTTERTCTVEQARKRRRIEILWVVLTVLYGVGRAVVVGLTLSRYGVNPWVYGAIDATTSIPLGFGTARATTAAIDRRWRTARKWGFIAAAAFIAPDVSIFVMGGGRLPSIVFFIVCGVVLVTGSFAIHEARVKIRDGWRERQACRAAAASAAPVGAPAGSGSV